MIQPVTAGRRSAAVQILAPPTGRDALGQRVDGAGTWTNVGSTWWCSAEPLRGREFFAAGTMQSEASVRFRGPWRDGITAAMRVLWRGVPHAIVAEPIDVEGKRHTLELMCAAGVRDSQDAP